MMMSLERIDCHKSGNCQSFGVYNLILYYTMEQIVGYHLTFLGFTILVYKGH